MDGPDRLSLSPAILNVLQVAIRARSTCSSALAERLGLAPATVDQYFKLALDTLDVHSRADAILKALDLGLVPGVSLVDRQIEDQPGPET